MIKQRAFTLLELLIVIIIIGVLAAIAMTQYSGAIANSKNSAAKAVLGEMRKAAVAYEALNRTWPGSFPITADLNSDGTNEVSFTDPTNTDFTYTTAAGGTGSAAKKAAAGVGVNNWTIDYASGVFTST